MTSFLAGFLASAVIALPDVPIRQCLGSKAIECRWEHLCRRRSK